VHVVQKDFAAFHARVAVAQIDAAFTDGFDFGALQRDAGLEALEQMVVVHRLAVFGDVLARGLALGGLGHGADLSAGGGSGPPASRAASSTASMRLLSSA
jgi:hypothetical protein